MSTFTTTKQLEQVARGADVGVWDTPENANWALCDAALAGVATIPLNNTPVVLNSAQFQQSQITFNSTLTGSVSITFPTSFTGPYMIQNACTGSSAFIITLQTTVAGGQVIGCPFGEIFDIFNDGTNIKFRNLGRVGLYEDWLCSSTPAWLTACTVPPYLNCNGTTFSSAIYPTLAVKLGGTTLPDSRGRNRIALNDGTNRVTTAGSGVDGDTVGGAGGSQSGAISQAELPAVSPTFSGTPHQWASDTAEWSKSNGSVSVSGPGAGNAVSYTSGPTTVLTTVIPAGTISVLGSGNLHPNMPPTYTGGITVVRAG